MKTKLQDIVDVNFIGQDENPINQNELYDRAAAENISPAIDDKNTTLLIAIDEQRDFMEKGNLAVPGSHADMIRATSWMYNNLEKITRITCSIDTHQPFQIFFPYWWIDKNGNKPTPFTLITKKDVEDGKWIPVIMPKESLDYVTALEQGGKKVLCIWPPHCIEGTKGHSLENQFTNMVYFHSIARKSVTKHIVKGYSPATEMYGIFKPEYDPKNTINIDVLNAIQKYDRIVVIGQAKSHCVLESIKQMLDHYNNTDITKKIYILEDCMSNIPGFEKPTEIEFDNFKTKHRVNIVTTQNFNL